MTQHPATQSPILAEGHPGMMGFSAYADITGPNSAGMGALVNLGSNSAASMGSLNLGT